jgi:hypothetical protein
VGRGFPGHALLGGFIDGAIESGMQTANNSILAVFEPKERIQRFVGFFREAQQRLFGVVVGESATTTERY